MKVPVVGRTLAQLQDLTTPKAVDGGNMEVFRHHLYDTQTYPAAGTAAPLTFFQNTNADQSLCNLQQAATLPDPDYMQVFYIQCDILLGTSDLTIPLAWRDMDRIIRLGRPVLSLRVQGKDYGPWKLTAVHGSGAPVLDGFSDGAGAGVVSHEYASNGPIDGGWCQDGSMWLTPKTAFTARILWGNPLAVAADTLVCILLDGAYYRAIR